jgi:hypothetical protein
MDVQPLSETEKGILKAERRRCASDALITLGLLLLLQPLCIWRLQLRHPDHFKGNFLSYMAVGSLAALGLTGVWYLTRRRRLDNNLRAGTKEIHFLLVKQIRQEKGKKILYTDADRAILKKINFYQPSEIHVGNRIEVHFLPGAATVVQVLVLD